MNRNCLPHFLLVALLLLGVASAQIDERARELLEGSEQEAEALDYDSLGSLAHTVVTTTYHPDGSVMSEMTTETAIDFVNERLAVLSFVDGELVFKVVYSDGEVNASSHVMGTVMALPEEQVEIYKRIFEQPESLVPTDYAWARYEGVRSYGGVLEGEQVVIPQPIDFPGVDMATELALLFDEEGEIIGSVSEVPDFGTMLMVFERRAEDNGPVDALAFALSYALYRLEGDRAVLITRSRLEDVRIDEPLDESLFALE